MKSTKQKIEDIKRDDLSVYSDLMRSMPTNDSQDPFDEEIKSGLDSLSNLYDLLGPDLGRRKSKTTVPTSSSAIDKVSKFE